MTGRLWWCMGKGTALTCRATSGHPSSLFSLDPWSSGRGSEGLSGADGVRVHEAGCFMADCNLPQESSDQKGPEARAFPHGSVNTKPCP